MTSPLLVQADWLMLLAIPVACVTWTITHEELFREFRDLCKYRIDHDPSIVMRKFFYALQCEFCLSHYAIFALVWMANVYMSLMGLLRAYICLEKTEMAVKETLVPPPPKD